MKNRLINKDSTMTPIICCLHEKREGYKKIARCMLCRKVLYLSVRGITGEITIEQIEKLSVKPQFIGRECMIDMCLVFVELLNQSPEMRELTKQRLIETEFERKS